MAFADKLQKLMDGLGLNQIQVSDLTGVSRASVSQYLTGRCEPHRLRRQAMAKALGVQSDYFEQIDPVATVTPDINAMSVADAARLMGKSYAWVAEGLKQGALPFGYAVKLKGWSYYISAQKFYEYTGIQVPTAGN